MAKDGKGSNSDIDDELAKIDAELTDMLNRIRTWRLSVGPLHLRVAPSSQLLALLFGAFHLALAAVGIVLIIVVRGVATELGVALVVGALFAFGSFLAQVWLVHLDRESSFIDTRDFRRRAIQLQRRYSRLIEGQHVSRDA